MDRLPKSLEGYKIFMVGIKGTGMAALAELLTKQGAIVTGSDIPQKFFTDEILNRANIPFVTTFSKENITEEIQMVIHSSAYPVDDTPELIRATELGLPILIYTEALGFISSLSKSVGISGIHGKTTTTALTGTIVRELSLKASTLVGSGVPSFEGSSIWVDGSDYFIAETCEYQRHFLSFHPKILLITSIEMDHPDYFKSLDDIYNAFLEYIERIPSGGEVIYCIDDSGNRELISRCNRDDITFTPYGVESDNSFKVVDSKTTSGLNSFRLKGIDRELKLRIPGHHTVLDAAGAVAVAYSLLKLEGKNPEDYIDSIEEGLFKFRGTKRRLEILGEAGDVIFIDDYGHHPTAIKTTIKGIKDFYPDRRIIVDFMSHTYTRTAELLTEFASSFDSADVVVLNKIYSSAREIYSGKIDGRTLFEETKKRHNEVYYCHEYDEAVEKMLSFLKPGDVFVTMGAGNNWQVGEELFKELSK